MQRPSRKPQESIPPTLQQRQELLAAASQYVARHAPVPPLRFEELRSHADVLIGQRGLDPKYRDYVAVLINNEAWRESLAPVPFERRLLLLPKCLRDEEHCPAPFDEVGLLCKNCGLCSIQELQEEAERLGYAVLVAEGSALVTRLIQTSRIEAIVGVSCLHVLEKAFPYMESAAIPGVAIPLLQDDCADTNVDMDWLWDVIHLTSDDQTRRLDLDALRHEVEAFFAPAAIAAVMGEPANETERLAQQWLAKAGKRWRPFLTACTYKALCGAEPSAPLPEDLRKIALAVECFHKASLIHDDIEDHDEYRYGQKTLCGEQGVEIALNVGDLLIGEGYRLIALSSPALGGGSAADRIARMTRIAAAGHRTLCLGQGAELVWARNPQVLTPAQVIDIFRQKTAPAFNVALQLGAIYAGADEQVSEVLAAYSDALGIAYQIRDDLEDWTGKSDSDDALAMRPGLLLAIGHERSKGPARELFNSLWHRQAPPSAVAEARRLLDGELRGIERARGLLDGYKEQAIRALRTLESASLKGLLRRVIGKIFNDLEIRGWCSEFEDRNAAGRAAGAPAAG
jgi:geranylgeranyl pyrophosphate synthase